MNKEQINKEFFEDLYEIQKNQINTSTIDDARKVILKLILYMDTSGKGMNLDKDEAILEALKWLKNHRS